MPLSVIYKGIELDCGYRLDFLVAQKVVLELKAVDHVLPIHEAQLMTYLRLSGIRVGLIINFNAPVLKDGIVRRVLEAPAIAVVNRTTPTRRARRRMHHGGTENTEESLESLCSPCLRGGC